MLHFHIFCCFCASTIIAPLRGIQFVVESLGCQVDSDVDSRCGRFQFRKVSDGLQNESSSNFRVLRFIHIIDGSEIIDDDLM